MILLAQTVSLGQAADANTFDPGILEFGTTYYWRVDEVNNPASPGTTKGRIWSFTVEPVALKLTYAANSKSYRDKQLIRNNDPNNTVNEVGLDPNFPDQHSNGSGGSWASSGLDTNNVWIQYDFDNLYKIHEMFVWNYNSPLTKTFGFKEVLIQYSEDGETWKDIPDANMFARATGGAKYVYNTTVEFNDVVAQSVRITALSNYGGKSIGLSEIRFTYIPVRARKPSPADETADVAFGTMFKWRKGREASNS